ncbi:hypothetical protein V8G54_013144 [Vigna mungo]|uniref:Uncharacterized protein n=1 Tax=Vigna mungo TaxID=3915 RepID=A0AAQ3NWB0_VIGMU
MFFNFFSSLTIRQFPPLTIRQFSRPFGSGRSDQLLRIRAGDPSTVRPDPSLLPTVRPGHSLLSTIRLDRSPLSTVRFDPSTFCPPFGLYGLYDQYRSASLPSYLSSPSHYLPPYTLSLPVSFGKLSSLRYLSLSENQLSGNPFESFRSLSKLSYLDIGYNRFEGVVMENHLINLTSLREFFAAGNNLTLKVGPNWHPTFQLTYLDMSSWQLGRGDEYGKILGLVTSIDLSNNELVGEIPREITDLNALLYMNLSHNQLIGHIPQNIGNMESLLSIDFSRNKLSGEIPPTISNLSFLSMLDLSYNNLNGKIPTGTQLQTFDASNFIGNNLCGPPLPINCSSNDKIHSYDQNGKGSDRHGMNLFFVGMTFGFVVGFWIVVGPLVISRSWRYAYFHFLDHVWFKLQYFF